MEFSGPVIVQFSGIVEDTSKPGFNIRFCACIATGKHRINVNAVEAKVLNNFSFIFF
jgi:hypothetical protein